ncbi:hypothetical protein DCCM_2831 [Desulfocucumis palustris]|uniref:Uncharacterized protein n=1 Tax=Desulfocucumis palustris TaxID=1898651 RepID=A0A2L2XBX8_9FIRM|nr:hypothetical protein DCCM_2831 [Desulfocucumis palustris]
MRQKLLKLIRYLKSIAMTIGFFLPLKAAIILKEIIMVKNLEKSPKGNKVISSWILLQ